MFRWGTLTLCLTGIAFAAGHPISPVLECVVDAGNGQYIASFGYKNTSKEEITVAAGSKNQFYPGPSDRGQVTRFLPGRVNHAFSVQFDGRPLVWTVSGPDERTRTATASLEQVRGGRSADLNLTATRTTYDENGNVWVTFVVRNEDHCNSAESATVELKLDTGVRVHDVEVETGDVEPDGRRMSWTVGRLARGETRTLRMLVSNAAPDRDARDLRGSASHRDSDPDQSDNDASVALNSGSSSGHHGGLESNGRLAQLLARRLLLQRIGSAGKNALRMAEGEASDVRAFIPEQGPANTTASAASPRDLIGVTNASAVEAYDYFDPAGRRLAAVLVAVTPSGPYEHTKATCDRLTGAHLEELREVEIAGLPFILVKLRRPDGNIDYAVSFAASASSWPWAIDSRWDLFREPRLAGQRLYNFQVWAADAGWAAELTAEIVKRMPPAASDDVSLRLPGVYVESGQYRNGKLRLSLRRLDPSIAEIDIQGTVTRVEGGARETIRRTAPFSDTIEIDAGRLYDASFYVNSDLVYMADGAWSHWAEDSRGRISQFEVRSETGTAQEGRFTVERGINARGVVTEYVTLLRHLQPGAHPVDLSAYDYLEFTGSGKALIEVIPQKSGISEFSRQFRKVVELGPGARRYRIAFSEFGEEFTARDITTLVFNVLGTKQASEDFEVRLDDVAFGKLE